MAKQNFNPTGKARILRVPFNKAPKNGRKVIFKFNQYRVKAR